jgi:hypothetical protein
MSQVKEENLEAAEASAPFLNRAHGTTLQQTHSQTVTYPRLNNSTSQVTDEKLLFHSDPNFIFFFRLAYLASLMWTLQVQRRAQPLKKS